MSRQFVFFDLGQTLIDEWDFINYLDTRFVELLNGYGAKIDQRNYRAVRDSVIRDRKIGHGSARELVIEVCRLLSPSGYDKVIAERLKPEMEKGRKDFFRFSDEAVDTLTVLEKSHYEMGLIANQGHDVLDLLEKSGLNRFFKVRAISSLVKLRKPDPRIFEFALREAGRRAEDCIMVGDRLDTDICPAKTLGMTTIRTTNSLFWLQEPERECEVATYTISRLSEIPSILEKTT